MRIALLASGSRGDVQPYIALGKGLKQAGYTVRVVTHKNFEELIRSHGIEFWPLRGDVHEIAQSSQMSDLIENGNFLSLMSQMAKEAAREAVGLAEDALAACKGMDLIIAGMGGLHTGIAIAEHLQIPLLQAYVVPFTPTQAFPSVLLPGSLPNLGKRLNRWSHHLMRQALWQGFRSADKRVRKELLDLPSAPFFGPYHSLQIEAQPILYGISPSVIAKPPDWDANVHVTGYWFLDEDDGWEPPTAVKSFLKAGKPPVYVGFGSIGNRDPAATADLVLEALDRAGQRGIMLSGWGGLQKSDLPENVLMVESVPHSWLFPRMAVVVHHGGVGTTAAGLRSGVPSVVIPFFGDQPFWGQRVAELGVGPEPISRRQLTVEGLALAIERATSDEPMRHRAARLGEKIRSEDGITPVVNVLRLFDKGVS